MRVSLGREKRRLGCTPRLKCVVLREWAYLKAPKTRVTVLSELVVRLASRRGNGDSFAFGIRHMKQAGKWFNPCMAK